MIHFIHNIGDYFASNYFDEDFSRKVIGKSGYGVDAIKQFNLAIARLKPEYFKLKQKFIENHLRTKDKLNLSHAFHSLVLTALGYDAAHTQYDELFSINDKNILPVRHILYRGDQVHLMVMEMHALIKTGDEEPDGLFEQSYNVANEEEAAAKTQKYHRSHWADIFTVRDGMSISPMIINQAINELFLQPMHLRPKFILLCGGNQYFLLEAEKWFRGSYLQLDLEALFDDASVQKDYYAVFYLLLGKELLAPTAEMVLMDQLDEDAHKAAYEVTKDLKEGVIHAVENLANEAVQYLKKQGVNYHEIDANLLKNDCLNMVYRLLFLFYAEAREDLDILPSNDEVYERGYSLEMLRDLEQVPLVTESSINGYFFHDSLFRLFNLLNKGYREEEGASRTFKIRHLDSPLFNNEELHYLNRVKIRNVVWQDVICELSLSKKQRGKNRGRISYTNLGINQLGSVYESLLAFRGFLAETDYIEVHRKKKKGESSEKVVRIDGSFLVPRHRLGDFHKDEIYYTEKEETADELKVIPQGSFIYRLSGRDRQKSASYYTPEVLTQTTVKYTLKPILERLDKGELKAPDLLKLKILEPAMGAAAFHNEVINQLAQAYLTYRQQELNRKVDPNHYQEELQKIKAYIALNNVYGVDLNPTAVELGKLSLWLNVIHKDMQTPFFGYRLGVGNAVVGSWLKVFKYKDFSFEPKGQKGFEKKEWWTIAPRHLQFGKKGVLRREDEIYHFLLPDDSMVASAGIKLLKDAYPAEAVRVAEWRKVFCEPIRQDEYTLLQQIAKAIDALLLEHYEIQKNISLITEANTAYFGNENASLNINFLSYSYEQKEKFARERLKTNAPYYKLKQIMDYWCSLWFWDLRAAAELPTRRQWYQDLVQILNIDLTTVYHQEQTDEEAGRDYRKDKKQLEKQLVEALKQSTSSLFSNERAVLVKQYADQYRFFHYELEFIEVFRENNGFDIAVGNPPWLKWKFEELEVMGEIYPELMIREDIKAPQANKFRSIFFEQESNRNEYFNELIDDSSNGYFMSSAQNYPLLQGVQTNLYTCVIENSLKWVNEDGFIGLVHPDGIFNDPKGYAARRVLYKRLFYHFHFKNSLTLFQEVKDQKQYSLNVYSGRLNNGIRFDTISHLLHPSTIDECYVSHLTELPLMQRTLDGKLVWDLRGNQNRIITYDEELLLLVRNLFDDDANEDNAKLPLIYSRNIIEILNKLNQNKSKVRDLKGVKISVGFDETIDMNKGKIQKGNFQHDTVENFIFSGPHIFTANSYYKSPREISNNKSEYDTIQPSLMSESYLQNSLYQLARHPSDDEDAWKKMLKIGFRKMLNQTADRTLNGTVLPKGTMHINGIISVVSTDETELLMFGALSASLLFDFYIKATGKGNLNKSTIENLPLKVSTEFEPYILFRFLLLTTVTRHYRDIWEDHFMEGFKNDTWSIDDARLLPLKEYEKKWDFKKSLSNDFARRQALLEIDVLVAMAFNVSLTDLIDIYNVQFRVFKKNEDDTWYDSKGNIVFTGNVGLVGVGLDRPDWEQITAMKEGETYTHTITKSELYQGRQVTYHAPFTKCDRAEDYKRAWAHFEKRFNKV
ncbi:plasmid-like protein [Niastella koreensis GR20-10]|uniref:site-specific DNA-methyltransferase (adenine-specific) n=2 Tax=Niastella koreensis TaxID=354356 RepID=G8TQ69_NIAKG|nr:hypothetical protein [Niastella koreensis]AEW01070.1 plasmid-like protein [Niastella koreensis GR20-10]